jgi:alpha-tubulin suppressor-like RCC1 family protein
VLDGVDELFFGDDYANGHLPATKERVAWGTNAQYQLGTGGTIDLTMPSIVDTNVDHVVVSGSHGCEMFMGGIWCWGSNTVGESAQSGSTPIPMPLPVAGATGPLASCTRMGLGPEHSCVICSGTVYCWGRNYLSQLGRGVNDTSSREVPAPPMLPVALTFEEVTAGFEHTCALDNQHALYCWGNNPHGQLGDGGHAVNLPTLVGPRQ